MNEDIKRILSFQCNFILKVAFEYIIPLLQLAVVFVNVLNGCIFATPKYYYKNSINRYLTANSIIDAMWYIFYITMTQPVCNRSSAFSYSYQFYTLYIGLYLARVFGMISSLISVKIAFDKYMFCKDSVLKNKYQKPIKRFLISFTVVSLLFFIPNIIFNKIYKIDEFSVAVNSSAESNLYFIYFTEFAQSQKSIKIILFALPNILTVVIIVTMIALNGLIYKYYKNCLKSNHFPLCYNQQTRSIVAATVAVDQENQESSLNDAEMLKINNQITLMVFWISCAFTLDQIITTLGNTIYIIFGRLSFNHMSFVAIIFFGRTFCALSYPFFFYKYSREYRRVINRLFSLQK